MSLYAICYKTGMMNISRYMGMTKLILVEKVYTGGLW